MVAAKRESRETHVGVRPTCGPAGPWSRPMKVAAPSPPPHDWYRHVCRRGRRLDCVGARSDTVIRVAWRRGRWVRMASYRRLIVWVVGSSVAVSLGCGGSSGDGKGGGGAGGAGGSGGTTTSS